MMLVVLHADLLNNTTLSLSLFLFYVYFQGGIISPDVLQRKTGR